ncbi:unnamed protein product [Salmonella enterica subsp. enterica serovar Typhimurium str. DT2]|nr:unnamed protein product [Salmonella enterica subsp. enterica serovar Typhimurium str. DT2]
MPDSGALRLIRTTGEKHARPDKR